MKSSYPEFSWKGYGAEKLKGSATWRVGGQSLSMELPTFERANNIAALLVEAYLAGYAQAKKDAGVLVHNAIERMTP